MIESCWCSLTVDKHGKAEEIQIFLSSTGVPANVRVSLRQEHRTRLQSTASQVGHHLHHMRAPVGVHVDFCECSCTFIILCFFYFFQTISRSCSWRANASSLLSMQEAAATSRGVEPLMPERREQKQAERSFHRTVKQQKPGAEFTHLGRSGSTFSSMLFPV